MEDTAWRQNIGKSVVAIFSCPGRKEMENGRPISGGTGKNFDYILRNLEFEGKALSLNDISITNSWPNVEFDGLTERHEADDNEILNIHNLNRLCAELENAKIIFVFGKKAKLAVNEIELPEDVLVVEADHPSPLNVNAHIKEDENRVPINEGSPERNRLKRLDIIVQRIVKNSKDRLKCVSHQE